MTASADIRAPRPPRSNPRLRAVRVEVGDQVRNYSSGAQRITVVPLTIHRRHKRKLLIAPPGAGSSMAVGGVDTAMVKTLGKAMYWQRLLNEERHASASALARALKLEPGWVAEVLRLSTLASDIIEAIFDGRPANSTCRPCASASICCHAIGRSNARLGGLRPRSTEPIPTTGRVLAFRSPSPASGVQMEVFAPWSLVERGPRMQIITPLDASQELLDEARGERLARGAAQDSACCPPWALRSTGSACSHCPVSGTSRCECSPCLRDTPRPTPATACGRFFTPVARSIACATAVPIYNPNRANPHEY